MRAALHPVRRRTTTAAAATTALLAPLLLSACGGATTDRTTTSVSAPAVTVPSAAAITTAGGTWATIAMGHLQEPQNTFWQLLHSPDGRTGWTDDVAATATATNGGLVVGTAGSEVAAGVVPSQALTFSPVVSTLDGGAHWTTGLIPGGLAPSAFSLALGPAGSAVALTGAGADASVRTSSNPLRAWTTLVTAADLAATAPGRACGLTALDTVAYGPTGPVVGGTCTSPGQVGRFVRSASGTWVADAPALGSAMKNDPTEVVSDRVTEQGSTVVVAVSDHGQLSLVPAWRRGPAAWTTGTPLALADQSTLDSVVTAPDGRLWVLQGPPDALDLDYAVGPGSAWQRYATPPAGTATVAPGPDGSLTALAVDNATLDVWSAASPAGAWTRGQTLQVPIEYGSSS